MLIIIVFDQLLGILLGSFIVLPSRITSIKDLMPLLPSLLPALFISFALVNIIAYPIFIGILTLMVKNILEKKKIEPNVAFKSALNKAPTLIVASFIVDLLFLAGILLFIIPGVIISIWYFYMKAARTPCALWRRDELPPDRPTSTNSREAPEVKKELWDGEFWTDVITLP